MIWQFETLKAFLDSKVDQYNRPEFIETDPIQIPHLFKLPQDIEIAGFLTATMAWGQRKTTINKSKELMHLMENNPFNFVTEADEADFSRFEDFIHRTFNATDVIYFIRALRNIYMKYGGLRQVFERGFKEDCNAGSAIDIGAYEFAAPIVVRTLADEDDGSYAAGDLSLREALWRGPAEDGGQRRPPRPGLHAPQSTARGREQRWAAAHRADDRLHHP